MKVVGIDLGTTNSVIAIKEGNTITVIPNAEGSRLTPSAVTIMPNGERLVGQLAKRQAVVYPDRTILSIKRKMGSDYKVTIDGKSYTPQEISAMILQKLKKDAEEYLGEPVTKAVITVPAYFTDAQRQATKDAGTIAGFEVLRIINEPTAACLAYGIDKNIDHKVLVFDLGGGTFDVSILDIGDNVYEVLATSGDNHLGGDDWDQRIINWVIEEFKKAENIDLSNDKLAMQRIREAAEKAKIELSTLLETEITIPFITTVNNEPKHINLKLTRAKFEEMTEDLVKRLEGPIRTALNDAKLTPNDIDKILLVGGSTRMPMVQRKIKEIFGKEPAKNVNPDECVAIGAAIQAAILAGEKSDIVLVDVTPLSLGVETLGGVFTKIIERNTAIPVSKSQIFTTAVDDQTSVEIHVLQGERPMAADNISLGRFILEGIPRAPRGVPKIEVTFTIDVNGILQVSAKDLATGKSQAMTIKSTRLSESEIEKMRKEAEEYAEQDKKRKELVEERNALTSIIYDTRKLMKEYKGLTDSEKESIENILKEAEDYLSNNTDKHDIDTLKNYNERIREKLYEITSKMYAEKTAETNASNVNNNDNTVNADNNTDESAKAA